MVAVTPVTRGGAPVSSGRIRQALALGRVGDAARLLGRPHALSGSVERGAHVGARLGFPTANLAVDPGLCLPATGIYATWLRLEGRRLPAASSIGFRPTFGGSQLTAEAHVLDFAGDLYGRRVSLEFVRRLRDERRFGSERALAEQIGRDVARVRDLLRGRAAA